MPLEVCIASINERGWNFIDDGSFHVHIEPIDEPQDLVDIFEMVGEVLGPQARRIRVKSVLPAINTNPDWGPQRMTCVKGWADYDFAA